MTFRKSFDCYEFYDRAKAGEKSPRTTGTL